MVIRIVLYYDISVTIDEINNKCIQYLFRNIFLLIMGIFYFNNYIYNSNIDNYINN